MLCDDNWNCFRPLPEKYINVITDKLVKVLKCDVERLEKRYFAGWGFSNYGERLQPYRDCVRERRRSGTGQCGHILSSICQNSTLVAAKTIRTPLYMIDQLLESLPGLKVVYYTRDPRGIIRSRTRGKYNMAENTIKSRARDLCNVMTEDFNYTRSLAAKYPNRFKMLKYEELAMKPKGTTEALYAFVGRRVPKTPIVGERNLSQSCNRR